MRSCYIVLTLVFALILTTGAIAQEKKKGQGGKLHPFSMAMMKFDQAHTALTKVELTEAQQTQLNKLHESMNPKLAEVMKTVTEIVGQENMKAILETAKKAKEAGKSPRQVQLEVEKVCTLNDDQQKKLEDLAKDVTKIHRGMMKEVNNMLTDDQKETLKKAMTPAKRGKKKAGK